MDTARCDHQTWVNSATNNTSKWIPCSFIEPIQELIKTTLNHIRRCTIVKPIWEREKKNTPKKNGRSQITSTWSWLRTMPWKHDDNERIEQKKNFRTIDKTYHGSNSWIILSNRMTANKRDANPDIHASIKTAKVIKLLQPAAFRLITVFLEVFIVHKQNI